MGTKKAHLHSNAALSSRMGSSYSGVDREDLMKEMLLELDRQQLIREVLKGWTPPESKARAFVKHPAFLLVLGFILTTWLGSWLTSDWQRKEWERQQLQVSQRRKLDQKYALADEFNKAISETMAAADDILNLFKSDWDDQTLTKEEPERMAYWRTTSRDWRITSKLLQTKLSVYFSNPQTKEILQEVILQRRRIGNNINRLLADYRGDNRKTDEAQSLADETIILINGTLETALQLTNIMVQEARRDEDVRPQ